MQSIMDWHCTLLRPAFRSMFLHNTFVLELITSNVSHRIADYWKKTKIQHNENLLLLCHFFSLVAKPIYMQTALKCKMICLFMCLKYCSLYFLTGKPSFVHLVLSITNVLGVYFFFRFFSSCNCAKLFKLFFLPTHNFKLQNI